MKQNEKKRISDTSNESKLMKRGSFTGFGETFHLFLVLYTTLESLNN